MNISKVIKLAIVTILIFAKTGLAKPKRMKMKKKQKAIPEKTVAINIYPLSPVYGGLSGYVEAMPAKHIGILLGGGAQFDSIADNNHISLGLRYHFSPKMESTFLGLYYSYNQFQADDTYYADVNDEINDGYFQTTTNRYGVNIGHRWVWDSGFNIAWRIGAGDAQSQTTYFTEDGEERDQESINGELMNLGLEFLGHIDAELTLGYAF